MDCERFEARRRTLLSVSSQVMNQILVLGEISWSWLKEQTMAYPTSSKCKLNKSQLTLKTSELYLKKKDICIYVVGFSTFKCCIQNHYFSIIYTNFTFRFSLHFFLFVLLGKDQKINFDRFLYMVSSN